MKNGIETYEKSYKFKLNAISSIVEVQDTHFSITHTHDIAKERKLQFSYDKRVCVKVTRKNKIIKRTGYN